MSVTLKKVSKYFGNQKVLKEISFEIPEKKTIGFLGPNGAGKTTTLRMLTGYLKPTTGFITVCGLDVQKYPQQVAKNIGYLAETNPLYTFMYVREYLSFIGKIYGLPKHFLQKRINKVIEICGLEKVRRQKIYQLSKGYRQRVGIAKTILHEPKLIILDEPTVGVDIQQMESIRKMIRSFNTSVTIIFSTHIMQEVEYLCDQILMLDQGELILDIDIKWLVDKNLKKFLCTLPKIENLEKQIQRLPKILKVIKMREDTSIIITRKEQEVEVLDTIKLLQQHHNTQFKIEPIQDGLDKFFLTDIKPLQN